MNRFKGSCAAPRHQPHLYLDDATVDHRGNGRCVTCGLPQSNRLHELPERSDEQREHEARRMGEA